MHKRIQKCLEAVKLAVHEDNTIFCKNITTKSSHGDCLEKLCMFLTLHLKKAMKNQAIECECVCLCAAQEMRRNTNQTLMHLTRDPRRLSPSLLRVPAGRWGKNMELLIRTTSGAHNLSCFFTLLFTLTFAAVREQPVQPILIYKLVCQRKMTHLSVSFLFLYIKSLRMQKFQSWTEQLMRGRANMLSVDEQNHVEAPWVISQIILNHKVVWKLKKKKSWKDTTGEMEHLYLRRYLHGAHNIIRDSSHPSYKLLNLFPSRSSYRSFQKKTAKENDIIGTSPPQEIYSWSTQHHQGSYPQTQPWFHPGEDTGAFRTKSHPNVGGNHPRHHWCTGSSPPQEMSAWRTQHHEGCSHPSCKLPNILSSRRRYRSIQTQTCSLFTTSITPLSSSLHHQNTDVLQLDSILLFYHML